MPTKPRNPSREKAELAEHHRKIQEREIARIEARSDAAIAAEAAAIKLHRPELSAAHADNNLPEWFERLLKGCQVEADEIAREIAWEAGEEAKCRAYDAAYVETYNKALPTLLARALGKHDARDPTA
jgi:hypothetical protein